MSRRHRTESTRYGYDKMSGREIQAVVNRLYDANWQNRHEKTREQQQRNRNEQIRQRPLSSKGITDMIERLSRGSKRVPDSNRTGACKQQGICNTYAWKGWN